MSSDEPRYINRELSWLEFNHRVLEEALDERVPLLDRVNFLAITASNLDEFFMVRVGGLRLLQRAGSRRKDPAGMTPERQLKAIGARVASMVSDQYACYAELLEERLPAAGIRRLRPESLSREQGEHAERYFNEAVFPVVTPMAVGEAWEFPLLLNLGLNVAVRLERPDAAGAARIAVLPVGAGMDRFVSLKDDAGYAYMLIEDMLAMFSDRFFPGEPVAEVVPFRITRNADIAVQDEFSADLLAEMEAALAQRKRSDCVRLEIGKQVSPVLLNFLRTALGVEKRLTFLLEGPPDLADYGSIASLKGFDSLRYEAWPPQSSPELDPRQSIFEHLKTSHTLLYHPYDSFDPVLRLIQEAAQDPEVMAIKQTLYRTSSSSPVMAALKAAAQAGKYVTALVELKARFDEARNIGWAKDLEEAGVQVIYGVKGLKTHSKICLVVRREPEGVVRYLHLGTGNYNERTARLYTDVSYLTSDPDLGADASVFFNAVCGYSEPQAFLQLEAAPFGLRETLLRLVQDEIERSRQGQQGLILAKMNSLADPELIEALYEASQAGVTVKLNVRGICCLRAGVPGLSSNISVVSIVDRFLEHARIFYFRHGGEEKYFISSADWMPRNLDRRVELLVPVHEPGAQQRLMEILQASLDDDVKGRRLHADDSYRRPPPDRSTGVRCQQYLYEQACKRVLEARQSRRTLLETHRPRADARET